MPINFTKAIEEVQDAPADPAEFRKWLRDKAPEFAGAIEKDFGLGDVHVPTALGNDKKKKPISVTEEKHEVADSTLDGTEQTNVGKLDPEVETFDSAGSSDRAFAWFYDQAHQQIEKIKIKAKHKVEVEVSPAELKALKDSKEETLTDWLDRAITQATVKKQATRRVRIIRHGATHLNNNDTSIDRIRGWKNVPLSPEGKDEATKLAEKMAKDPPNHLVTSDLKRAHDTAKIIAKHCNLEIDDVTQAFRPWDVGKYAGTSSKDSVPILADYAVNKPDEKVPEGTTSPGESFNTFRKRFMGGLADAIDNYPDGLLAVVTHHRGERLVASWEAAGFPADGTIDGKEFTKKGEGTAGWEDIEIPVDQLHAAASAKVTKWIDAPDFEKLLEPVSKPWSSNASLPPTAGNLPEEAKTVFRRVANDRIKAGASDESAIRQAWSAVKNGWRKDGDKWVRKNKADEKYLDDMIDHHEDALPMARQVIRDGEDDRVREMARNVISAQTKEIRDMRALRGKTVEKNATLTPSLLLRLLEFAREGSEADIDLHQIVEAIEQKGGGTLDISSYSDLVPQDKENAVEKTIEFDLQKTEPDKQHVFGWASISTEYGMPVIDKQDDIIPTAELEKGAYDFVLYARSQGDMHSRKGVGRLIESMVFTKEKQDLLGIDLGKEGWWVGFKVDDPQTWVDIKEGRLPEFSIGGKSERKEI